MVSKSFTAEASPSAPAFSVPNPKLGKITKIEVDNHSTNGAITVMVKDKFTPDPSIGNPSPSQVERIRKVITVAQGGHFESNELEIPIYGDCFVEASRDDPDVSISMEFSME